MGLFGPPDITSMASRKNVKGLIKALAHKEYHIRKGALEALVSIGNEAVFPLIDALKSSLPMVRKQAAWALGEIHNKAALDWLTAALQDKDKEVREFAREAVNKLKLKKKPETEKFPRCSRCGMILEKERMKGSQLLILDYERFRTSGETGLSGFAYKCRNCGSLCCFMHVDKPCVKCGRRTWAELF